MALRRKTEFLHIRIEPGLRERFALLCEDRGLTLSEGLRRFMQNQVGLAESQGRYKNVQFDPNKQSEKETAGE